jgi:hypothetical protein
MDQYESKPWKGFVLGVVGSVAGLAAMSLYWQYVAPQLSGGEENSQEETEGGNGQQRPFDNISLVGKYYREEESSTEALGRRLYENVTGYTPRSETREMLSYLIHWGYGLAQGGLYGALRSSANGLDLKGGLLYGTGLWLLGDELAVPALGLQGGPTSVSSEQHLNRLGAHLAYGLGTAAATQILRRIF